MASVLVQRFGVYSRILNLPAQFVSIGPDPAIIGAWRLSLTGIRARLQQSSRMVGALVLKKRAAREASQGESIREGSHVLHQGSRDLQVARGTSQRGGRMPLARLSPSSMAIPQR